MSLYWVKQHGLGVSTATRAALGTPLWIKKIIALSAFAPCEILHC